MRAGDVLVADMTDPDWEPVMKRAAAIVTNRGGRTCHAAIIARELGIPAVVGCGNATARRSAKIRRSPCPAPRATPATCTTACSNSTSATSSSTRCRAIPVKIMMNVGNPDRAFDFARHAEQGRRPRAARVHHQPHDRRASAGAARVRQAEPRAQGGHLAADRGLCRSGELLRRQAGRGHRADRGGVRARAGDRAPLGLQVERVREPHRRQGLRAARGESDARIPRRLALHRQGVPALLRARVPRAEARARRDGPHQRAGHGAVRAHARSRRRPSRSCSRTTA